MKSLHAEKNLILIQNGLSLKRDSHVLENFYQIKIISSLIKKNTIIFLEKTG